MTVLYYYLDSEKINEIYYSQNDDLDVGTKYLIGASNNANINLAAAHMVRNKDIKTGYSIKNLDI
jgi:hypothetical protein